jgi:hypothetical protein
VTALPCAATTAARRCVLAADATPSMGCSGSATPAAKLKRRRMRITSKWTCRNSALSWHCASTGVGSQSNVAGEKMTDMSWPDDVLLRVHRLKATETALLASITPMLLWETCIRHSGPDGFAARILCRSSGVSAMAATGCGPCQPTAARRRSYGNCRLALLTEAGQRRSPTG